ncbi:MAG TPA: DUF4349 domain-containing protein [Solirubrobacterales bacterium]|nr:DUF4349 domain-containing protein [Solirubrobacterales bacterium]
MSHDSENDFGMNQEFTALAQVLRENRPTPEPGFTERLDQAVADHFPPEWADEAALGKQGRGGIGSIAERFRRRTGRRPILLPAMAGFAGLLLVATVVVSAVDSGRFGGGSGGEGDSGVVASKQLDTSASSASESGGISAGSAGTADSATLPVPEASTGAVYRALPSSAMKDQASENSRSSTVPGGSRQRDVALEAEIVLGTDPDGVQDVANEVVSVTDEHNGIVMDSSVTDGEAGNAVASFSLLIPSGQVEEAVADLSGIADLKSRSQELTDITAPTNRTEDDVADSKAKIESLLSELEDAPDEATRQELEQKLANERSELSYYESRLKRLERRADYSPVDLRVETGGESSSGGDSSSWGLGDAIDDAGKMLGVAAGVTVLALAVAIPIGIVLLIALALNRAWVRRSRRRVLADEE